MYNLATETKTAAIAALCEGVSIRAVERMTGAHRDTIMRLGVRVGQACTAKMSDTLRSLKCADLQLDEIWGYVGKKEGHKKEGDSPDAGDTYTFVAIDRKTKLVPCFRVGKRDKATAVDFLYDLADRLANRPQLSSDAFSAYADAVERGFGSEVDYGQIVKTFTASELDERRYSPPDIFHATRYAVQGNPDPDHICTSHVEAQNLTMRMHIRVSLR